MKVLKVGGQVTSSHPGTSYNRLNQVLTGCAKGRVSTGAGYFTVIESDKSEKRANNYFCKTGFQKPERVRMPRQSP